MDRYGVNNENKNICKTCIMWVLKTNGKGFCLNEPLFTETARGQCSGYIDGKPMTEREFDNFGKTR